MRHGHYHNHIFEQHLNSTMDACVNQTLDADEGLETEETYERYLTRVISTIALPAVCVFGMVGNLLNLAILTRRKLQKSFRTLEQAANLCLISLAVSDLMFCVFAFPTMFLPADDTYENKGIILTYRIYCAAIINVFIMESTMLTVAMSLERYLAICFPLRQDLYLTTRRIKYVIVFTFIFSVCFNIPVLWRYEVVTLCASNSSEPVMSVNTTVLNRQDSLHNQPSNLEDKDVEHLALVFNVTKAVIVGRTSASSLKTENSGENKSTLLSSSLASSLHRPFIHSSSSSSVPSTSYSSSSPSVLGNRPSPFIPVRYTVRQVMLNDSALSDTAYRIAWAIIGNFVPLVLLFYFNVCLCRKIYRSYKMRKQFKRQNQAKSSSHILTITLVAIVVMFFILVAPSEISLHVSQMMTTSNTPAKRNIEDILNLMQSINFSVNFILYCIISPYFRKTLKYMMLCGCYNIYQVSRDWKKEFETSLM